jgi:hypothetical protein
VLDFVVLDFVVVTRVLPVPVPDMVMVPLPEIENVGLTVKLLDEWRGPSVTVCVGC